MPPPRARRIRRQRNPIRCPCNCSGSSACWSAPMSDPQTQSRGIFYLIENASHQFAPGMSLKVTAPTSEAARSGVLVPRDAILRAEGADWVYLKIAPDKFTRREIKPDQMTDP